MAITLTTAGGQTISVEDQPFASGGGEGVVHKIVSPSRYNDCCVKLYHDNKLYHDKDRALRERKLDFMVRQPPDLRGMMNQGRLVCWPRELVYRNSRFVGFVMLLAFKGSHELYALTASGMNNLPSAWHSKYDRDSVRGYESRLKLCVNIAAAVHKIHEARPYVLVDFKPQNMLVTDDGKVSLIDLDSVQITNGSHMLFHGPVATDDYAPVESDHIHPAKDFVLESWDRFSLAVVLYELLFGLHPYNASYQVPGKNLTTTAEGIKHGLFVFGSRKKHILVRPPPHDRFTRSPRYLQDLFMRAFDAGHNNPTLRPTAEEWGKTIHIELLSFE